MSWTRGILESQLLKAQHRHSQAIWRAGNKSSLMLNILIVKHVESISKIALDMSGAYNLLETSDSEQDLASSHASSSRSPYCR
ncbi:hypothetical protein HZ326_0122 [Fusarium oxysporum f. sp. albedinis]|nr:hypothetical protein HZ326_0122 [Fusarium oxysporum f. sp. albedinis]